jgi:hypothetical protein
MEADMKLNKKQLRFIEIVEKCGYLLFCEVNTQEFPISMVDALISKGLIVRDGEKLLSTTAI